MSKMGEISFGNSPENGRRFRTVANGFDTCLLTGLMG
jgi:hypothetical protein